MTPSTSDSWIKTENSDKKIGPDGYFRKKLIIENDFFAVILFFTYQSAP